MTGERAANRCVQIEDARLLIRWAAQKLNPVERAAVEDFYFDRLLIDTAADMGVTKGGVWMARQAAFRKMRARLARLGIRSTAQIIEPPDFEEHEL